MRLLVAILLLCSTAFAADRPLPVLGCWNTGENQTADGQDVGYSPDWQIEQVQAGKPWHVTFEWYDTFQSNERAAKAVYFEPAWSYCRDNHLPIAFVGRNFIDLFRLKESQFASGPDHPFVVRADGSILKLASPWSPHIHRWYNLGYAVGRHLAREYAADYPDPPEITLYDNSEQGFAKSEAELNEPRRPAIVSEAWAKWGSTNPSFARQVERAEVGRAYVLRYGEFKRGLRDALPDGWKKIKFVEYSQFGNEMGIAEYTPDSLRYGIPWAGATGSGYLQTHDGVTCRQYLSEAQAIEPWIVRSPQTEAGNVRFGLDVYRETINRDFFFETHLFNGRSRPRAMWKGSARCVLWQMRERYNRVFLAAMRKRSETFDLHVAPVMEAIQEVHEHETLRRFWQQGVLCRNYYTRDFTADPKRNQYDTATGYGHPYTRMLPKEFADTGKRHFLQHVPLNERLKLIGVGTAYPRLSDTWIDDRSFQVPVKVFAIALKLGDEYLVYAHAPQGALAGVDIDVHATTARTFRIRVDVPQDGGFWLRTADGTVERVQ